MRVVLLFLGATLTLVSLVGCQAAPRLAPAEVPVRAVPPAPAVTEPQGARIAVFAGGCFWGVEAVFERLKGVSQAVSGYSGGQAKYPTYDQVSMGTTGHAEAVEVTYDPQVITYGQLLQVFFSVVHDPTQKDYQGPDHGTQYRSAIFYGDEDQRAAAEAYVTALTDAGTWPAPIVTQIVPLEAFWTAEDEHQNFLVRHPNHPYIVRFDQPKLVDLALQWPELVATPAQTWRGLPVWEADAPLTYPVVYSEAQWQARLGSAYGILRQEGTERAFTGALWDEHRPGTYYSAATGQPLFRSEDKYDSGTGWPSFTKPIDQGAVVLKIDRSFGVERVEVEDSSSGSHLGHVFDDGPAPTGLRYCMNSASLIFVPDGATPPALVASYR